MALMDEFKKEREAMKTKPCKDKIEYIFDYYKGPIIAVLLAIIVISYLINTKLTAKEEVLNGILINTNSYGSASYEETLSAISDEFLTSIELDTTKNDITLNTSITIGSSEDSAMNYYNTESQMVVFAQIAAGAVDFMTADVDTLVSFAYRDYFCDLSDVLSDADYAAYEPYFLYIDGEIIEKLEEMHPEDAATTEIVYPDCTQPETMEKPIPVLIDMSQSEIIKKIYGTSSEKAICFAFTGNMPHPENALKFFKFLM